MARESKRDSNREFKPKLRFPEFQGEPRWQEKPLKGVCEINPNHEGLPESFVYIDLESVEAGNLVAKNTIDREVAPSRAQRLLGVDDVIYQTVRPYQRNNLYFSIDDGNSYVASTGYAQLRAFDDSQFLFQLIHTDTFVRRVIAKCTGSNYPAINSSDLAEITVTVPEASEQSKIGACLSLLDELIAAERRKLEVLQAHKKGLMQQLFPREGETLPRLRFPEFRDAPEWDENSLTQVAEFRRGSFPQPYGLPEWYDDENGKPFVQVYDVDDNFRLKEKTKNRISDLAAAQSVFIPAGTVLITLQGSIGRVAITQYDAYVDRTLLLFQKFLEPLDKTFFAYVIHNLFDIEKRKAPGGIIKTITKEVLSSFEVKLPALSEQEAIARCMSSIEEIIAAQVRKFMILTDHKKGLMQQLFPSMEDNRA